MKIVAVIPARLDSSRFPGKLLKPIHGESVIARTYQNVVEMGLFDRVYVATDSNEIASELEQYNANVIFSKKTHSCGSDRIAEAVENIECDIVINVQGDEPFIHKNSIKDLIDVFKNDTHGEVDLASLMSVSKDIEEIKNPNNVKVVVDSRNYALYFSRSPIPYFRNKETVMKSNMHHGVYAFRKETLQFFSQQKMTPLENIEQIECIRYLECGKKIKMVYTEYKSIGIDTPDDLEKAIKFIKENY